MNETPIEYTKKLIEQALVITASPETKWSARTPEELTGHTHVKTAVEYTCGKDNMRVLVVAGEASDGRKFCHGALMVSQENGPLTVVNLPTETVEQMQKQALTTLCKPS